MIDIRLNSGSLARIDPRWLPSLPPRHRCQFGGGTAGDGGGVAGDGGGAVGMVEGPRGMLLNWHTSLTNVTTRNTDLRTQNSAGTFDVDDSRMPIKQSLKIYMVVEFYCDMHGY